MVGPKTAGGKYDDIEELYEQIKAAVHESAKEALGTVDERVKSRKWWQNDVIAEEVNKKKEPYLKWLTTKTEEDREIYREARTRVKLSLIHIQMCIRDRLLRM